MKFARSKTEKRSLGYNVVLASMINVSMNLKKKLINYFNFMKLSFSIKCLSKPFVLLSLYSVLQVSFRDSIFALMCRPNFYLGFLH